MFLCEYISIERPDVSQQVIINVIWNYIHESNSIIRDVTHYNITSLIIM